jgi:hypothetical protein
LALKLLLTMAVRIPVRSGWWRCGMSVKDDLPDIVWNEINKRFDAYLLMDGRRSHLGSFQTLEDAAMARTQAAWLYVEQFAPLGAEPMLN